ncbi:MAG: hypothetical protein QGH02_04050 [Verrucomicrobiota bacterium]|nr:hypothetical protein [Verrucomicrobiota bacterium]
MNIHPKSVNRKTTNQQAPADIGEKVASGIETKPSVLRMKVLFALRFNDKPRYFARQAALPYPTKHLAKLAFGLASGWLLLRCHRAI